MRKETLIYVVVSVMCALPAWALARMSSSSYQIERDALDSSGLYSSSSTYQLEDTLGEDAAGRSSSASYTLKAGYQQFGDAYIAITQEADLTLSSISGLVGGSSEGTATWRVTTDNPVGYQLSVRADQSPALQSVTDSVADYVPAGAAADFSFSILPSEAAFGFTPEGSDIVQRYLDNGSSTCGVGSSDTPSACWDGLSTSNTVIAESADNNHPAGTDTSVRFRAEIGGAVLQPPGDYTALITVTAIPL